MLCSQKSQLLVTSCSCWGGVGWRGVLGTEGLKSSALEAREYLLGIRDLWMRVSAPTSHSGFLSSPQNYLGNGKFSAFLNYLFLQSRYAA